MNFKPRAAACASSSPLGHPPERVTGLGARVGHLQPQVMPGVSSAPGDDRAPGDDHAPLCATLVLGQRGPVPRFGQAHPIAALAVGLGSPKAPSCPLPRPRHTRGDPPPIPSYRRWRGRAGPRALVRAGSGWPSPSFPSWDQQPRLHIPGPA